MFILPPEVWNIDFDFDAYRRCRNANDLEETMELKVKRDMVMAEFRYRCEKEIVRLRAEYEELINKIK